MPYITQDDRKQYDESLDDLGFCLDEYGYVAGHVTYVLYKILLRWWKKNPCYDTIASIRGCLVGTLSELDRRWFFPYEDKKIRENGDVVTLYRMQYQGKPEAYDCGEHECLRCNALPGTFHNEGDEG